MLSITSRLTGKGFKSLLAVGALTAGFVLAVPAASPAVPQLRSSDNYRLGDEQNPLRGSDTPGLAVDPSNPDHIVEVNTDLNFAECQFATTFDGGETWSRGILKPPPNMGFRDFEECTTLGHGANAMDAGVAWGTGQNVYVAWGSARGDDGTTALVSKSTDGGVTFPAEQSVIAMPGGLGLEAADNEYPKLAVKPGGGVGGADMIVVATDATESSPGDHAITGRVKTTVSMDGGATWGPVVQANPPASDVANGDFSNPYGAIEHTQPVFGRNGEIHIAWRTSPLVPSSHPTFQDGFIRIGTSLDNGQTWTSTNATNVKGYIYTGPIPAGSFGPYGANPTRFCCSSFPRLAVDPASGALYMVWSQDAHLYEGAPFQAQDHFMVQRSQVWFMRSADGGATWTDRKRISESPLSNLPQYEFTNPESQTRHPNVSVAPNGRVDIVWQDRRHAYRPCTQAHTNCPEARLGDTYYSNSFDGGVTFSPNRRITDRSMNNDVGFDYRFSTYWNFGPVAAALGNDKILFAWQDSREGNFDTDTQDIYLSKLDLYAGGDTPARSLGSGKGPELSVALSNAAQPGGSEAVHGQGFTSRPWTKVVIARTGDKAGILAGGVLARAGVGPLLLSGSQGLPDAVKDEVARVTPVGAYVIGSQKTLSDAVVEDLAAAAGLDPSAVTRIDGTSPAAVAKAVAVTMDQRTNTQKTAGIPAFDAAIIANAQGPEAAAAANLAASRRLPVLYVNKTSIPQETADALAQLGINKTLVIGGPGAVGAGVEAALAAAGRNPTRLGGADQYATSRAVVQESIARGLPTNQVFVADGSEPEHGALLGASSARIGGLFLLTPGGTAEAARTALGEMGLTPRLDRILTSDLS